MHYLSIMPNLDLVRVGFDQLNETQTSVYNEMLYQVQYLSALQAICLASSIVCRVLLCSFLSELDAEAPLDLYGPDVFRLANTATELLPPV